MRRVLRGIAIALLVALAALALLVLYAVKSHWFPRLDSPWFDQRKAALLAPDKRRAYEQELFSELDNWNRGSKRYTGDDGIERRALRWREMADDGFELAHIVLRVLQIPGGVTYSLYWPMKRLEVLAEGGDVGAMCLMVRLVNRAARQQDWRPYHDTSKRWLEEGARRGHPECLLQMGGRLLRGTEGFEKDIAKGLELSFAGHAAGYEHGAGALVLHYRDKGLDDPENVRRLFCWSAMADKYWGGTTDGSFDRRATLVDQLRRMRPPGQSANWDRLVQELTTTVFTLNDCINLGKGD